MPKSILSTLQIKPGLEPKLAPVMPQSSEAGQALGHVQFCPFLSASNLFLFERKIIFWWIFGKRGMCVMETSNATLDLGYPQSAKKWGRALSRIRGAQKRK